MQRTVLSYQRNGFLTTMQAVVKAVHPVGSLSDVDRSLFKQAGEDDHVVITDQTIFHPQGGGQPSDVGHMHGGEAGDDDSALPRFDVLGARMSVSMTGTCLHFGRFASAAATAHFQPGVTITQQVDVEQRTLFSRYHTAGHVLGAAVKAVVAPHVPGFDETKASHFPDAAACEFAGAIEGKWKAAVQAQVDELVARDLPVEIDWWDEQEFRANGLERLIPDRAAMGLEAGEKFRVVKIVGAETYPCGGTHVASTKLCGRTEVKKISRSKGTSRVSYVLP